MAYNNYSKLYYCLKFSQSHAEFWLPWPPKGAVNLHIYIFFQETAIRSEEEEVSMFDKLIIGHITTQRALTSEAIPALEQPSELRV